MAPVIAIKAEDHYVRVYTAEGDRLVLMRFADAVQRLQPVKGIQVHRSYWVRESAIAALIRKGRQYLTNGLVMPVSRARARDVRCFRLADAE